MKRMHTAYLFENRSKIFFQRLQGERCVKEDTLASKGRVCDNRDVTCLYKKNGDNRKHEEFH